MKVSSSTKKYFEKMSDRLEDYFESISSAKTYVDQNIDSKDENLILKIMIASILWTAAKRNENLSENEVLLMLGLDEQGEKYNKPIHTEKEIRDIPLKDFLSTIKHRA